MWASPLVTHASERFALIANGLRENFILHQDVAELQTLFDALQQLVVVPGFGHETEGAGLVNSGHQGVDVDHAGQQNTDGIRLHGPQFLEHFDAVHVRHAVIGDHRVKHRGAGAP